MQMRVKDLLPGSFSIRQEQAYALTPNARLPHRLGQIHRQTKETTTHTNIHLC
jgi:hypothetical protein